jgi:hypothetical protein
MLFGKYQFSCCFTDNASLPSYKGSTFRGVFGRALKQVVCALKAESCTQCLLRKQCVYALVFETGCALEMPEGSKIVSQPHPFVIEPPLSIKTKFEAGTPFDFNLLLFGEINNSLPYFIYAFEQMGTIGIGKKIKDIRGRFSLNKVKSNADTIYSKSDKKLHVTHEPIDLSVEALSTKPDETFCLKLTLETPLRLKFENRLKADLPFHVLVRAMLRRASSLLNCYGAGEPPLDYPGLVQRAASVQTIDSSLKWFDWQRYSFRQEKSMLMGGITGSVIYKGHISEYLPLIEFCEKTHLGKQTAFGLGKIKTEQLS